MYNSYETEKTHILMNYVHVRISSYLRKDMYILLYVNMHMLINICKYYILHVQKYVHTYNIF